MENIKERAISLAKYESIKLFLFNRCYSRPKSISHFFRFEREKEIIQLLGLEIGKSYNLYDEIVKSDLTISLYDIISWFNEQYNLIREKSKDLPDLNFSVYKWEKRKEEEARFVFENIDDDCNNIFFRDQNESYNEFFHRFFIIGKKHRLNTNIDEYTQKISSVNDVYTDTKDFNVLSKESIDEYLNIAREFYDYLVAYSFFKNDDDGYSQNSYPKGSLTSTINGTSPFKNLEQFNFNCGLGGNEDGCLLSYDLGSEVIQNPYIYYNGSGLSFSEIQNEFLDDPDMLAKTVRIRMKNLPFHIK